MRTIKDMLSAYISEAQNDWDEFLKLVQMTYNSTVNDATGFSLTGTEMSLPHTTYIREQVSANQAVSNPSYVARLVQKLQRLWDYVGDTVVDNVKAFHKVVRNKLTFQQLVVGDEVYMKDHSSNPYVSISTGTKYKLSNKLKLRYSGPYVITQVKSPVLYVITVHGKPVVVDLKKK